MDVPFVKREDFQLMDISDDGYALYRPFPIVLILFKLCRTYLFMNYYNFCCRFLSLMTDSGDLREDLKLPDGELGAQVR